MTSEPAEAALVLDCLGLRCPLPVVELAHRIRDVPAGGVVAVWSDDPAARVDVPAWCRMTGQEYVGMTDLDRSAGAALLVRRLH